MSLVALTVLYLCVFRACTEVVGVCFGFFSVYGFEVGNPTGIDSSCALLCSKSFKTKRVGVRISSGATMTVLIERLTLLEDLNHGLDEGDPDYLDLFKSPGSNKGFTF